MAEFLSPAWFDELSSRLSEIAAPSDDGTRLALGQVVTDAPGGEIAWTIVIGGGAPPRLELGVEHADVVLVERFQTALEVANGTPSTDLLYAGKIKLRGNVGALLEGAELLSVLSTSISEAS